MSARVNRNTVTCLTGEYVFFYFIFGFDSLLSLWLFCIFGFVSRFASFLMTNDDDVDDDEEASGRITLCLANVCRSCERFIRADRNCSLTICTVRWRQRALQFPKKKYRLMNVNWFRVRHGGWHSIFIIFYFDVNDLWLWKLRKQRGGTSNVGVENRGNSRIVCDLSAVDNDGMEVEYMGLGTLSSKIRIDLCRHEGFFEWKD